MKKTLYIIMMVLGLMSDAIGQAKKPTLMVVPSDSWCQRNHYMTSFSDETGTVIQVPDYQKAVSYNDHLRLVISEMARIMAERGFPLKDLEQNLKSLKQEDAERSLLQSKTSGSFIQESPTDKLKRTAKADIILDLDFDIKKHGPQRYITFNLRANDAYSNKIITSVSGEGKPSFSITTGILLEEAVLNYMDAFNASLMGYFDDMAKNGREIKLNILLWEGAPFDLEEEFDYLGETLMLSDIIDFWMDDNCVKGRYSRINGSDSEIRYEQVRIPLYQTLAGKERAIDARRFISGLNNILKKEPFNITSKIYERGLGEVWLIIGEQ
ncbi:MAG: DUF6175 family protein [Parabacteroides sp.]|nr:DUF6175 family protein [Parabacteroides sp.]